MKSWLDVAAAFVARHTGVVLLTAAVVTGLLGASARHISVSIDSDSAFPAQHPLVRIDRVIRAEFGGRNFVILAIAPRRGRVWRPEVLTVVRDVTLEVMELPNVIRKDITSLASPNARVVELDGERIVEDYLMREVPVDAAGRARLRRRYRANPLYRGFVVSADERVAFVLADFWPEADRAAIAGALRDIVARHQRPTIAIHATGEPLLVDAERKYLARLPVYFGVATIVIAATLYVAFRSVQGMLLPLLTGLVATVWGLGFMQIAGVPLSIWNQGVPMLVLIVGAGHSAQVLKRYLEELSLVGDNALAVRRSLVRVAPAMVAAGGTAAVGFASLGLIGVSGMRDLGLSAAMGIASAVILELTFMPALRARLRPAATRATPPRSGVDLVARIGAALETARGRRRILTAAAVIVAASIAAMPALDTDSGEPSDYLPSTDPTTQDFRTVRRYFPGTVTMTVLFEGPPGMAKDPRVLRAMQDLGAAVVTDPNVARTTSVADLVAYLHHVFTDGGGIVIPTDPNLVAQLMFLGAGPAFEQFLDRSEARAVVWIYLRSAAPAAVASVLRRAQAFVDGLDLPGVEVRVAGGLGPMNLAMHEYVTRGKLVSMAALLGVSWAIASVVLRSPVAGMFVALPLVLSLLVSCGVLVAAGLRFDVVGASVLTIAVAIGADYAIYVLYRIREERDRGLALEAAVARAIDTSGRAVVFVGVAIALGFMSFIPSPYLAIRLSGLLTPITMVTSSIAAVTVMPALLLAIRPRFIERRPRTPESVGFAAKPGGRRAWRSAGESSDGSTADGRGDDAGVAVSDLAS